MLAYIIRRLLLIIPTLFGIMVLNFAIIQAAPGGPVEQLIAELEGTAIGATSRITGAGGETVETPSAPGDDSGTYRGRRGLEPEFIAQIEKLYGFDKPAHERFLIMMGNYIRFDFGNSFFRDRPVVDLVIEKMPVSISLGLWTTLLMYLISIPLGIRKAVRDGTPFDTWTSAIVVTLTAIPSFLFAILLVVLFAGGSYWNIFPLRGLVSSNWSALPWHEQVLDYLWHMVLPITALVIGSFAGLTMLTKNSFLDQISMAYVSTARAKGLSERRVLYGHVFRNAMLIVIAAAPGNLIAILFAGSLLIETIFSLDGLGLLSFESLVRRDYPVVFGTMYFLTLIGLLLNLVGDLMYTIVDPRIDFERRAL
jgi:microcin C transport system permease protein